MTDWRGVLHGEYQRVNCRVALIEWQALLATECKLLNADTDRTRKTLRPCICACFVMTLLGWERPRGAMHGCCLCETGCA